MALGNGALEGQCRAERAGPKEKEKKRSAINKNEVENSQEIIGLSVQ